MKITILYLGRLGAGPVYTLEMAKALAENNSIQLVLSETIENKKVWESTFSNYKNVSLQYFKTYTDKKSFTLNSLNYKNYYHIIMQIKQFNPDGIYASFVHLWSPVLYLFLRKYIIFSTIHDLKTHVGESKILYPLYYLSIKLSDKLIILNNKDIPNAQKLGFKKNDIAVIPHASFGYYKKQNTDSSKFLKNSILFIGRIEKYKGIGLLLDAFTIVKKELPNLKLVIAGQGDLNPYQKQIAENQQNLQIINQWLTEDIISDLILKCDFVVLPYIDASQSGIIPLAYGCEKTVVATNVGALAEQVPEHVGILVEPDSEDIASAILKLYKSDNLIFELGKNALKYSETELSWEKSAHLLVEFMKKSI
ncbi:MAG: glycosyltransferase family 4 protein [Flavobacterium sp.]|nr:glycosyltransferase family 4 protein [Flavobacterium sp.]